MTTLRMPISDCVAQLAGEWCAGGRHTAIIRAAVAALEKGELPGEPQSLCILPLVAVARPGRGAAKREAAAPEFGGHCLTSLDAFALWWVKQGWPIAERGLEGVSHSVRQEIARATDTGAIHAASEVRTGVRAQENKIKRLQALLAFALKLAAPRLPEKFKSGDDGVNQSALIEAFKAGFATTQDGDMPQGWGDSTLHGELSEALGSRAKG